MAREAYATLLTSDGYLPGAEVLIHSIKRTATTRPVVVMVTAAVGARARSALERRGATIVEVAAVANPHASRPDQQDKCWTDSGYTKLQLWGLHDAYDKVVYIDVDAVVRENVDDLFALDADLAAAPDVFPPDKFNAGVLVVKPDAATHARLLALAPTAPSHDGGDTGFLNHCFPAWFAGDSSSRLARLPFQYNAQRTLYWMTHAAAPGYWDAVKPIKILHFSSAPKPWQAPDRKGDLEMIWWECFLAAQLSPC
mmetsp:Transcript_2362/g.7139  ORF Transcript_2362/g.7139 Transcript_2362/m.7139 type:complete len:254 (-) Transcript_2362:8-769(-)